MARPPRHRVDDAPAASPKAADSDADADARYRAPALDKGLDILELLSAQSNGLTRGEIVKAMGRGPSEIYRMLERLVSRDYVSRSIEGDRYSLSLKMFVLANRHPPLSRLLAHALPRMESFANASQQSCHLCVYDRGNLTVVAQVDSPRKAVFSLRLGAVVGLRDTASGQVLLAFQSAERREQMLAAQQPLRGELPISDSELHDRLESVRADGCYCNDSQHAAGVVDLSVPLLGSDGAAFAVLTCPYIVHLSSDPGPVATATLDLLLAAANALTLR
jgi:DNA-binding IclR family transcriptional regulator